MPEISIIVPVYNGEKYLHRCIDSILSQTFTDFELIIVDDGSIDNSLKICEEYFEKDKRVIVLTGKNKGVSNARNKGINIAKGRYIEFIDSDDYIEKDMLECLFKRIRFDKSDVAFIGFMNEYSQGEIYRYKHYGENLFTKNIKILAIDLYKKDLIGYTWCKLFKAEIIHVNNIKFNEDMKYCEDEEFTCNYLNYANSMSIIDQCKYHYINYCEERVTLCSTKQRDELKNREYLFIAWEKLLNNDFNEYLRNKAYSNISFIFLDIIWGKNCKEIDNRIKVNKLKKTKIYDFLCRNCINPKEKFLVWSIKINNILLFKLIYRILGYFGFRF